MNGDGHPDLVAVLDTGTPDGLRLDTDPPSADVSVLLGRGDGTFAVPHVFLSPTDPAPVAVADLNGDGHPDLVAANPWANNVAVRLAYP